MSLTNRRRVAGSSTSVIMRAATLSMSGSDGELAQRHRDDALVAGDRLRKRIVGLPGGQRLRNRRLLSRRVGTAERGERDERDDEHP